MMEVYKTFPFPRLQKGVGILPSTKRLHSRLLIQYGLRRIFPILNKKRFVFKPR